MNKITRLVSFRGGIVAAAMLAVFPMVAYADNSNTNTNANTNINTNTNVNSNTNTNANNNNNICALSSQTVTGKVETSQDLGIARDIISQTLTSESGLALQRGVFQLAVLREVIKVAGESDYPNTKQLLTNLGHCGQRGDTIPSGEFYKNICNTIIGTAAIKVFTNPGFFVGAPAGMEKVPSEVNKLKTWLASTDSGLLNFLNSGFIELGAAPWVSGETILTTIYSLACAHTNNYSYNFEYRTNQGGNWNLLSNCTANKCEEIKLTFAPSAEWLAAIDNVAKNTKSYTFNWQSPPTPFLACADQTSCLSQATEYSIATDIYGKGAQKVTSDFVSATEKSLTSSNASMTCANGVCVSRASGSYPMVATAPASSYFGQCRGYGSTINTPEVAVPAVTSNFTANIVNRPPVPLVSFTKNSINVNDEVNVTCDIVDPDECSDKIAKIKWTCTDSNGNSGNCLIWKAGTGAWSTGSTTQELVSGEKANPFRATAMFKASQAGTYAVTCEAWDDDATNPLSGTGIAGISVGSCLEDGYCNANCPNDPDCGVVPYSSGYCAVLSDSDSGTTVCGEKGSVEYKAYVSGINAQSYRWKCSENDPVRTSPEASINCEYAKPGTYLPSLSIVRADGKEINCVTQTSAEVSNTSKCKVEARRAGSGDEYSSSVNLQVGDTVEAKVTRQCLSGGKVNWSITDETGDLAKVKLGETGEKPLQASITQDNGQTVVCSEADLSIKEKVQWGN